MRCWIPQSSQVENWSNREAAGREAEITFHEVAGFWSYATQRDSVSRATEINAELVSLFFIPSLLLSCSSAQLSIAARPVQKLTQRYWRFQQLIFNWLDTKRYRRPFTSIMRRIFTKTCMHHMSIKYSTDVNLPTNCVQFHLIQCLAAEKRFTPVDLWPTYKKPTRGNEISSHLQLSFESLPIASGNLISSKFVRIHLRLNLKSALIGSLWIVSSDRGFKFWNKKSVHRETNVFSAV